ncbi:damage-control phosphatase ARMT1 [Drosophila innubila]|uniref:damage-control phosphatase ARMT1 n=1 Tax=Drosophila innubila TaxID=198719 RepID=UPI00148DBD9C|nr:damage-control phosphatase ARMT1 [Drosophila innubila]
METGLVHVESFTSQYTQSTEESSWHSVESDETDQDIDFIEKHHIFYTRPPLNEALSARYLYSFAYKTFRLRTPHMINDIIHYLQENEDRIMEQCGKYARYDLRRVIWSLDILRNEILDNREFKLFYDKEPDAKDWNVEIKWLVNREKSRWFTSNWLFAECYLYRRIWAAFRRAETLRNYDYFSPQKISSARNVTFLMSTILQATRDLPRSRENFQLMLKLSLWGNRCDLSITTESPSEQMLQLIGELDKHLITDQSEDVWSLLAEDSQASGSPLIVDIVLDNAGYELFTDLLLAEYIIESGLAKKVRFHVKAIPWFVSDVTAHDFRWMLNFLRCHEMPQLEAFGHKLQCLLQDQSLELYPTCDFWTRPKGFSFMREMCPCLYVQLSLGALVIFKGDLNYRKLLEDINYNSTTPFRDCLGGFMPTSICALRVIKSDIYCGMPVCVVDWLNEDDSHWMVKAEKAVIQLAVKPRP